MKCLLMVVAGFVFATTNAQTVGAQDVAGVKVSTTSVIPITGVTQSTDGNYNFKSFEINAPDAGKYYTEFWLLPARYASNSYTTFMVFVNDDYIGTITPTSGNWQAARVNGKETLELVKGANVITIATLAPEFPEVETIKVAQNDFEATLSSDTYDKYLERAISCVSYDVPEQEEISTYASTTTSVGFAHYSNIPLNYTFYKTFSFTQGQDIFITSSSSAKHKIDVVYYGSNNRIINPDIINPNTPETNIETKSGPLIEFSGTVKPNINLKLIYTPATSEEMQGLSYVYPSEKTLNSSMQVATAKLTIPKTGQYLVRVRHAVNGSSSVADVNVNGAYYYENTPIALSYIDCQIPADGNLYATMTCCNNFGTDDPYLFIHGANNDRIVGFNDDGTNEKIKQFNLSERDSYISQKYFMKTSGLSVNNYSSLNPISRCNIIARILEDSAESLTKMRAKKTDTTGMSTNSKSDESVRIIGPANIDGIITISAKERIRRVLIYGLDGNRIGSINVECSTANIQTSALNITQPGIYVVSVETVNGVTCKKVAVK